MAPVDIPDGGLDLSSATEDVVREYAMDLINEYVPSTTGDDKFAEIAKDYGGSGTTCGYLCHWLMWRMGCRDPKMVNRDEPSDGLHYVPGANISRIFANPHFVHYKPGLGMTPDNGDIVFLSDGPPDTEHVYVSTGVDDTKDPPIWSGANAGQRDKTTGKQCSIFIDRTFSHDSLLYSGGSKKIVGWVDISQLPFTAMADLHEPGE